MADSINKTVNIIYKIIDETSQQLKTIEENATKLSGSLTKLGGGITAAGKNLQSFGKNITSVGTKITAATAPLALFGVAAFKSAADLEDAMGAANQIFKGQSKVMQQWAGDLETFYGIAEGEALTYANTMGAMLQNIGGLTEEQAASQAQTLIELAGDLTAMFGGTTQDAIRALTGSLKGNNTMLDNYGMAVNDAMIKTKALELGLLDEGEAMTLAAKQAATLALITEQSGDAQGQAAREAEGASGTLRGLATEFKNLASNIGGELIPIFLPMIQKIKEAVQSFSDMDDKTKKMIVKVGLIVVAIGPLIMIIGGFITAIGTAATMIGGAVTALGTLAGAISLPAIAIGLLVAAVISLMAIFVKLAKRFGLFSTVMTRVRLIVSKVKATWDNFKKALADPKVQGAITKVREGFTKLVDTVRPIFDSLKEAFQKLFDPFDKAFGDDMAEGFFTVENIVDALVIGLEGLVAVIEFLTPVFTFISTVISQLIDRFTQFVGIVQTVWAFFQDFGPNMAQLWEDIKLSISESIAALGARVAKFFLEDIPFFLGQMVKFFMELPENIGLALSNLWTTITTWFTKTKDDAALTFSEMIASIVAFFMNLPANLSEAYDNFVTSLADLGPRMMEAGANLVQGFWDGLKAKWADMMDWFKGAVSRMLGSFNKGLGNASPSKFTAESAKNFADGFQIQLGKSFGNIEAQLGDIGGGAVAGLDGAVGASPVTNNSTSNSTTIEISAPVTIQGGGGDASGMQATIERVAEEAFTKVFNLALNGINT